MTQLFDLALTLAGIGHFCLWIASVQVPTRLGWKEDLAKLKPFNRKLLWTYSGFTLYTNTCFGLLTLILKPEFLRGDRAALGLSLFIGIYWLIRIVVDFAYFEHSDWPNGREFVLGHALLTALFVALSGTYLGLFLWQVCQ